MSAWLNQPAPNSSLKTVPVMGYTPLVFLGEDWHHAGSDDFQELQPSDIKFEGFLYPFCRLAPENALTTLWKISSRAVSLTNDSS